MTKDQPGRTATVSDLEEKDELTKESGREAKEGGG